MGTRLSVFPVWHHMTNVISSITDAPFIQNVIVSMFMFSLALLLVIYALIVFLVSSGKNQLYALLPCRNKENCFVFLLPFGIRKLVDDRIIFYLGWEYIKFVLILTGSIHYENENFL